MALHLLRRLGLACAISVACGSSFAVAAPKKITALDRKLTDEKSFRSFLTQRQPLIEKNERRWISLAKKLIAKPSKSLKQVATPAEAKKLFTEFREANIGTNVPLDGCAPRADVAAVAAMREGFAVQKVNYFSVGKDLQVKIKGKQIDWAMHVAPAVNVASKNGKPQLKVLDPALFDRPVSIATWKKKMVAKHGIEVVTGPDQLSYQTQPQTGADRIRQLAYNLAAVSSLRQFERSVSATGSVATSAR